MIRRCLLPLAALLLTPALTHAQPIAAVLEESVEPTPTADRLAGASVAIAGSVAVIGGPAARIGGTECGAAWIYALDPVMGWELVDTLFRPTSCTTGDRFGAAVAVAEGGDWVFIGVPGANGDTGFVRVYRRSGSSTTWDFDHDLLGEGAGDELGFSVAADGPLLVAGAPGWDFDRTNQGVVYLYDRDSSDTYQLHRALTGELLASTGGLRLGESVDIEGTVVIGGAPLGYGTAVAGRAYVWDGVRGSGWSREATFGSGAGAVMARFGASVAIHDGLAFVGAPDDGDGVVRYFTEATATSWVTTPVMVPAPSGSGSGFGSSLDAQGDVLLIGRPRATTDPGALETGTLHVYSGMPGAVVEREVIGADLPGRVDDLRLGASVATDGQRALAGAPALASAGRGYFFTIGDPLGSGCTDSASCATRECVDGVCCETSCGGSATDCMACSTAAGGAEDGTCTPLSATAAPAMVCRASAGECDVAETCDPSSPTCPADANAADGTECADALVCNGTETCAAGVCTDAADLSCDDGDACTADACAEPDGCEHTPIADCCTTDSDCDDGIACTVDSCSAATCEHDDSGCEGDAGTRDGGAGRDGGVGVDGGMGEGGGGGCSVQGSAPLHGWPLLALLLWRARRRR